MFSLRKKRRDGAAGYGRYGTDWVKKIKLRIVRHTRYSPVAHVLQYMDDARLFAVVISELGNYSGI